MTGWQRAMERVQERVRDTFADDELLVYEIAGRSPVSIKGVFDASKLDTGFQDNIVYEVVGPQAGVKDSDLPFPPSIGDHITARGTRYRVTEIRPDGQGWTVCVLEEV